MKSWINSKALDSLWSLIQSLKTYDFHQKIIENFLEELFERTYQRVHIFRLKLNSSLLLPFIRIEYVMTITVCSMATKPQDWHPIRVHCCVKQYKISPQVLFKTKTLMVVFRKNQSGECTQTIANAWIKSHFAKKIR